MGAPEMTPIIANKLAQAACSPWLRTTWNRWLSIAAIHCHHKETEIAAQLVEEMRVCDKSGLVFREFPLASGIINQRSLTPYQRFMTSQSQAKKLAKAKKNALKQAQTVERQLKQEHATAQSNQQTIKQSKPQKNEGLRDSKKAAVKAKPSSPSRLSRTSNKNDAKMDAALANEAKENLTVEYTFEQRDKIKILLKRLKETPHVFKGIKQVISFTLKVLSEECPIERVVFLTLSKDGKELKTGLSQVQKQAEPVPIINGHFEQTVVWKKFLPKPTFLLFDKDKHSKIWPQLPSVIINDHRVDFFLFNSLQYGGKVKAFLYADMALSGKRLPTQLINDFKKVSAGLAFAIRAQAKNNVTKT